MSLAPGSKLGPYDVLAPLGAGGMGEVWLARDPRLEREVAIKALPEAFARDPERLARFDREARLLASLHHPNIAGILGLEEVDGRRYLVLEYVEGPTLAERLSQGQLPLAEAVDVCRQIATAVEAAHESGVIHRDLKPGNVKITPTGEVKVLDFGLAKGGVAAASGSDPNLTASPTLTHAATMAGVILGTAAYMSPEQARGRGVDRRTDIWSFGCVLYECLTGQALFQGETVSDLIARILEREPDWSALPAATPVRVRELLRRCLRRDPKERLRDMGDARLELVEAMSSPPPEVAPAAGEAAGRGRRRGRMAWFAIGLALVALSAGAAAVARLALRPPGAGTLRVSVQAPDGLDLSGEVPDVTISPDGRTIVFAALDTTGTRALWLRPLDSNTARRLPGTQGAVIPFWSPDSRQLAFFAGGELKRMTVQDEDIQVVCPAPNPRGGAWGRGDVIVFAPTGSGPLMRVAASGGEAQRATTLDSTRGETAHRFPCFLPDGRHFLYVALPGKDSQVATRMGETGAVRPGPIVLSSTGAPVYAEPGYLLYNRQGTVVAQRFDGRSRRLRGSPQPVRGLVDASGSYSGSPVVMASRAGVLVQRDVRSANDRVDLLDISGKALSTLALPENYYSTPRFSPDGTKLVLNSSHVGSNVSPLWMVDLRRGISSRFTFEGTFDSDGAWTPDGGRVIYGSARRKGREIYWRKADASGPEVRLAEVPNLFNDPSTVSPDGRFVVYRSLSGETGEDLWMLATDGKTPPAPLIRTRFNELDADISPDGRWIAYRSDESGRLEIYVASFPGLAEKTRVSNDGAAPVLNSTATWVRWRRDGRALHFIGGDGQTIMQADVEPGAAFRAAAPRPLLRLPRGFVDADISPDGRQVVVCMPTGVEGRGAINLVMNWVRELEPGR
ncbi:MAG: serine/threonine-protein kinase [Candidatus Eisenbacteria bacterium]|nr:serine/threonine-protein kinase [Candidatus Eisenbacteria bacterium]